ncbi:MAG: DUF502 domain-containing protein [Gammaproteobacteria bacterium]|jgi:uncharacterized membrane protein
MSSRKTGGLNFKRNFISGIVTIIPLWITWLLFEFVFRQLSKFGKPLVRTVSIELHEDAPLLGKILMHPWFIDLLAVAVVVLGIYCLGWLASRVIGRRLLNAMESLLERLPLIQTVYGSVKKLVSVLQTKPDNVERVVLINFPHASMKAVGLVTRTFTDADTGRQLAAVYVPTTPNPTSGYLEIVPIEELVSTDWSIDQAMNFIISGGAIAPGEVPFTLRRQDA